MAEVIHKKDYGALVRGFNSRFLPLNIASEEATVLQNAQVNNNGAIEKYPGFILDGSPFPNTASSFIRTLFDFKRGSSTEYLLIAAADATNNTNTTYNVDIKQTIGDSTYQYFGHTIGTAAFTGSNTSVTGTNTSWSHELKPGDKIKSNADADSAYTEIATVNSDTSLTLVAGGYLGSTHTAGAYTARKIWNTSFIPAMTIFNNLAIIVDGNGIPQAYDGTSVNALINSYSGTVLTAQASAAPIGKYVTTHKSRVFIASGVNLYWSHVNDQTFWDPASFAPIFPQDGGDIVNITSFADSLFVFKNNGKVYRIFGNFDDSAIGTPAYITKVDYSENIGLIADRSVFVHGGSQNGSSLYFLAQTGVYAINSYGIMQRISYYIQPTTSTYNFSPGAQTNKSFNFTSKTQWDSGTHQGTRALQSGVVGSFFDEYRQTDALQSADLCSIAIGTDNVIHVAYVPVSNNKKVTYVRYQTDGTLVKEDIGLSSPIVISSVSISVSAADQTVGIMVASPFDTTHSLGLVERTPDVGPTLGTWGTITYLDNTAVSRRVYVCSFKYSPGGVPQVAWIGSVITGSAYGYSQRNAGVWTSNVVAAAALGTQGIARCSLVLDGSSNPYISFMAVTSTMDTYFSTNGGATWTTIETFNPSPSINASGAFQGYLDHAGHYHTVFTNSSNAIIDRNNSSGTSTTLDSTANSLSCGFVHIYQTINEDGSGPLNKDVDYLWNVVGTSPTQQEKIFFETIPGTTTNTVLNPTVNVINKTVRAGSTPFTNNGQVMAFIWYGVNSNEIVIRRASFYGIWAGPEQHDSTLTAWGTYAVNGIVTNGNTLLFKIALNSAPGASTFNLITPGAVISSNAALIYNVPRFDFKLVNWSAVQITSLNLNYTGAGIDSKQPFGVSFFDEAYFATNIIGNPYNNNVLIYDIKNSPLTTTYAVNCMSPFHTSLYAGSSSNGDLYILKQNFDYKGSAYTMDVQSKEDLLGTIELVKDFYKIYVCYQTQLSGSFIFSYRIDSFSTPGGSTWVDQTINLNGSGVAEIILGGVTGRSIQFRIRSVNAGDVVSVSGWSLHFGVLNRR